MLTLYKHIDGPYEDEENGTWFAVFLAEVDDDLCHVEVEFETFDDAYNTIKTLNESPDPLEVKDNVTYH